MLSMDYLDCLPLVGPLKDGNRFSDTELVLLQYLTMSGLQNNAEFMAGFRQHEQDFIGFVDRQLDAHPRYDVRKAYGRDARRNYSSGPEPFYPYRNITAVMAMLMACLTGKQKVKGENGDPSKYIAVLDDLVLMKPKMPGLWDDYHLSVASTAILNSRKSFPQSMRKSIPSYIELMDRVCKDQTVLDYWDTTISYKEHIGIKAKKRDLVPKKIGTGFEPDMVKFYH